MILNPWKALREAQETNEELRKALDFSITEKADLRRDLQEAKLRNKLADVHIGRLTAVLDQAHFRNPKTGRIGPRGRRY
jgi:hypothetical protein